MILVTGASQGIGLACALALLERTDQPVLITGRSQAKLDRVCAELPADLRGRLDTMVCDQSRVEDVEALITRVRGPGMITGAVLTVGVNPAYDGGAGRIHTLDASTIEQTVRTNCTHATLLTAAMLERLRGQRSGALVWIGSQAAGVGLPGAALYCATKSFLSGLARAAHNEYGRYGIRTHLAHPGLVRTPRTAAMADAFARRHGLRVEDASDVARQVVDLFLDGDPNAVEVTLS
ncbi:MAG TPA: SDR family oxidoreductase [Gemmatimonadaceae bacterium]|nr:SDR family oxidoreductase [Gemmatimonadaceae bacterium]